MFAMVWSLLCVDVFCTVYYFAVHVYLTLFTEEMSLSLSCHWLLSQLSEDHPVRTAACMQDVSTTGAQLTEACPACSAGILASTVEPVLSGLSKQVVCGDRVSYIEM